MRKGGGVASGGSSVLLSSLSALTLGYLNFVDNSRLMFVHLVTHDFACLPHPFANITIGARFSVFR